MLQLEQTWLCPLQADECCGCREQRQRVLRKQSHHHGQGRRCSTSQVVLAMSFEKGRMKSISERLRQVLHHLLEEPVKIHLL